MCGRHLALRTRVCSAVGNDTRSAAERGGVAQPGMPLPFFPDGIDFISADAHARGQSHEPNCAWTCPADCAARVRVARGPRLLAMFFDVRSTARARRLLLE
jgi:hypothetical protein